MSEEKIYNNPVQRGFFADPSVVRVGDDYYMANSSFQYFPAIPISHSKDMVHWHIIGHAIADPDYLDLRAIKDSHGIWAPDLSYIDGKFYVFATLRLNADGERDNNVMRRQLVMCSEKPEGPYSKPMCLEVDDIDPSHFVDDDGKRYMLIAPAVNAIELTEDSLYLKGNELVNVWKGTGERCSEGPRIMKKGEYYYAIVAEGGTGYGHGINVARSKSLFGEYEACPYNPVMRQMDPDAPIQRSGHGQLVEDSNGDWWCYYLCGRPNEGKFTTVGRETAMDPVTWTEDGWFLINEGKGPSTSQKAPKLPEVKWERNLFDDFNDEKFNLEWEFVRNPDRGSISLTERPGHFRIWTKDGKLNEIRSQNTLVRREQELSYKAETKVEFYPDHDGEQAGLTCYYSTVSYVRFAVCMEGSRKLQLVLNKNEGEELVAEVDGIENKPVYLKVEVDHQRREFFYSYDGENYTSVAVIENCWFLCDEGVPTDRKRHTGTFVGMYANNGGCGSRKAADFDFFRYED